jgi:hypothetical protein
VVPRWPVLVLALACSGARPTVAPTSEPPFARITLDTAPGLSGLAVDEHGALWTVAERAAIGYRITLDSQLQPTILALPIHGAPLGVDLEGVAVLGKGRLAFGTEGQIDGIATVLLADRQGDTLVVTHTITLDEHDIGTRTSMNHGAEGICAADGILVVAIEGAGSEHGKRWAPVIRIEGERVVRTHRVWLTTDTGKLSALDCRFEAGALRVLAIERHFEVTRLLTFAIADAVDIEPVVAQDLAPVIQGQLNLEGIAWLPDGRVVAVVDNQWKTIQGPSELLVFPKGTVP